MLKWAGEFFRNIIAGVFVLGIPAMIGWLAWLQDAPWFLIALAILGSVGLILFIRNQHVIYRKQRKRNIANLSDKEIERTVREWIDIPDHTIERMAPGTEILFNFLIKR